MSKSQILNHAAITQKLDRISSEILEEFYGESSCILIGLNERGHSIAKKLSTLLHGNNLDVKVVQLIANQPELDLIDFNSKDFKGQSIIIIDDVLESGSTMMRATAFVMNYEPKQIKTAVLVDRMHHRFPIKADFVGLTLSTTLQDHIEVEITNNEFEAYLI